MRGFNLYSKVSLLFIILLISCSAKIKTEFMQKQSKANPTAVTRDSSSTPTILGQDNFLKNHLSLVKNKRVGFVTNPSAVDKDLNTTADLLYAHPQVNLVALFGPEHGIRGAAPGGDKVKNTNDPVTGLPVYSLYGKTLKPTEEMLENIDVLIFEIQDIGVRGYTYIYTMAEPINSGRLLTGMITDASSVASPATFGRLL